MLNFCANNYLGLAGHPEVVAAAREAMERHGFGSLRDGRGGRLRRTRIPVTTIRELCRLRRECYPDFSVRHFYERATEVHGLTLSYTWTRLVLQNAGLAEKAPGRGRYRRKRERRPLVGLMLHLDASTHRWLPDQPMQDLVVMLDDADGRILYARFVPQEGTASTFAVHRSREPLLSDAARRHSPRGTARRSSEPRAQGARHPTHPRQFP